MPVNAGPGIAQPNPANPGDPNDGISYDIFEYNYLDIALAIFADTTAVSFHSIPIYLCFCLHSYPTSNSNMGLFQPRSFIMNHVKTVFSSNAVSPADIQWNNLFLPTFASPLRLLSTGKAMQAGTPIFDANYLDNAVSYGFSFIDEIWTSGTSFYRTNDLFIQSPIGALLTYEGVIQGDNSILFTDTIDPGNTFTGPTPPPFTTSSIIYFAEQ